jgi:hypothetical protein
MKLPAGPGPALTRTPIRAPSRSRKVRGVIEVRVDDLDGCRMMRRVIRTVAWAAAPRHLARECSSVEYASPRRVHATAGRMLCGHAPRGLAVQSTSTLRNTCR